MRHLYPQGQQGFLGNFIHTRYKERLLLGCCCLFFILANSSCASRNSAPPAVGNSATTSIAQSHDVAQLTTTEWSMEGRGPERNRASTDDIKLPLAIQDQYVVDGDAEHVSPIAIAGGRLFAESDRKLHAVALDSGKEQWQFNLAGSFLSPTVVDNTVFVRSETGEEGFVYALTADTGAKLWLYKFAKVGSSFDNVGGHVTAPVVVDGAVLVGAAQTFHALDAKTGQEIWKFTTEYPVVTSASVAEGVVYFSDFTRLYAVDLKTGKERWRFDHGKLALFFAPVILNNQVAIAGQDTIYLLNRADGKQLWSKSFGKVNVIPAGASRQHLYVKSTNQLFALNLQDGHTDWDFTAVNFISLPAIDLSQLYVIVRSDQGNQVLALQQSDGKTVWHVELAGLASAAPVIAGGRLYVREATGNVLVFRSS